MVMSTKERQMLDRIAARYGQTAAGWVRGQLYEVAAKLADEDLRRKYERKAARAAAPEAAHDTQKRSKRTQQ